MIDRERLDVFLDSFYSGNTPFLEQMEQEALQGASRSYARRRRHFCDFCWRYIGPCPFWR